MPQTPRPPLAVRMRRLKTLPLLPTLLTAGNLACGITAILCAAHHDPIEHPTMLWVGALMIFAAMVCDMFDGKVARLTKQDGPFGAELDSLADVVSFGVAPAMLVHRLVLGHSGVFDPGQRILWFLTIFYPVMAAIRLARYNVEHSGPGAAAGGSEFRGIPSPGAAAAVCALVLLHQREYALLGSPFAITYQGLLPSLDWYRWLLLGVTVACALLMVSTIRYPHIGSMLFGRMSFRKVIVLMALVVLLAWEPWWTLAVGVCGYLAYGVLAAGWRAFAAWRSGRNVLDDDEEDAAEDAGLGNQGDKDLGPAPGR